MIRWDIDRYDELQERAFELDAVAAEQDRRTRRDGRRLPGDESRRTAYGLRDEAAEMLTQYWVLPSAMRHEAAQRAMSPRRDHEQAHDPLRAGHRVSRGARRR